MAEEENIPEENPQEQITNSNEEVANENISQQETIEQAEQLTTYNLPPTTEDMEVHHHPDLHHKRKNFKEYLLEGLMIFIAVTLGFFAENIREHITENKQVHQYITSMVSDLQSDIKMYDSAMTQYEANSTNIDTLISDLKQHKNNGEAYYLARKLTISIGIITPNVKSFDQLKSTGSMRFIEHQYVSDSISSYYQWVKFFDYWADLQKQRIVGVINTNDKVFDATVFFSIYKKMDETNDTALLIPPGNPPFMTNDPGPLNSVMMNYQYLYGITKLMYKRANAASAQAKRLVDLLQNEYDTKNE